MPDSCRKIGYGWQALPHYHDARNEAGRIVYQLWRDPVYGRSRDRNGSGARIRGCKHRFMDRFRDIREAIALVTKIVLRDKYGETPPSAQPDEMRNLGR